MKVNPNSLGLVIGFCLVAWGLSSRDRAGEIVAQTAQPGEGNGRSCTVVPGSVYDGDTIRVLCDGEEIKVRFCGIDAPEKDQPLGIESRDKLRELLPDGAVVSVVEVEQDQYGRTVAEIWNDALDGEEFVNGAMVLAGLAWHYERYSSNCPGVDSLVLAEELARSQGLGVFAPGNVTPWEWRRR